MITKNQFDILYLLNSSSPMSQRSLAKDSGMSLGLVNKTLKSLKEEGLVSKENSLTSAGKAALDPYKVDNAIILAAGMATRFVPVSYEFPKGLTVVKGEVLIERQIRQLKEAGVQEIIVVVGHMMEKFLYLADKFGVKIVVNNQYRHKNTHSSLYFAREHLKNSYVCCADNYFPKSVFRSHEYHSLYSTVYMPGVWRGERGVTTDKNGLIIATQRPAVDQWVMNGYAYLNRDFTGKFRPILESIYDTPGTDGLYWEQVYAEHVDELHLYGPRFEPDEILEFDSVAELEAFDPDYIKYNDIAMVRNICSVLHCTPADIHEIRPIQKGYTNRSFRFVCGEKAYVYRTPGHISADWINRQSEKNALELAKMLGIDDSYIYEDADAGWKISEFVEITDDFHFSDPAHMEKLCSLLRVLYQSPMRCGRTMDYLQEANLLLARLSALDEDAGRIAMELLPEIRMIDQAIKADNWPVQLAHNDLYEDNLLISGDKLYLIDWEYAGDTDIGYDLCKLFVKNNAEGADIDQWLSLYYGRKPSAQERKHIVGCAAVAFYYWYVWALYMVKRGNDYSDLMLQYLTISKRYQKEFFAQT